MRFLKPILCLFLFTSQMNVNTIDTQILSLEKQVESIEEKEASELSKKISSLTLEIEKEKKTKEDELSTNKKIKKAYKKRVVHLNTKIKKLKKNLSFLPIRKYFQNKKIEERKKQKIELKKGMNRLDKKIKKEKKQIQQYDSYLSRLSICQKKIGQKYQESYQRIRENGQADMEHSVQGSKDLPAYGSVHANAYKSEVSCSWDGTYDFDGASDSWIPFVKNGTISAGTWAYPGGGMHLGLDVAASLYSPIVAGANGIVLYANAPVDSNCGYLGNYCGWPQGGGNTICMIMAVQNQLYGVSLNHLSNQLFVYAGQQFHQGDLLANSGNSGNSTGPHTHIEVFRLKVSMNEAVQYFQKGADFSFGCGWNTPAACSDIACRVRPEETF